ncbi:hypothetical protein CR205_13190 [Alteribacter lacisalsi]|uniref:Uncharacterized protein n=1 Tax=Alteribacter lacisalsi TaxID=2045244 RepID=A0A2W0HIL6_9BACI|nr:hypothetical protein [Alteribacter lacisalsi]PYZ96649.1 hypothetical protein CR205_13190 [Alteribacter lacisalsi]
MSLAKFIVYQFILFTALILLNLYSDPYISRPFTHIDLIATCITAPVSIFLFSLVFKMYGSLNTRFRNKILLSVTGFLLAAIFLAGIDNLWFEIKGKMLFQ